MWRKLGSDKGSLGNQRLYQRKLGSTYFCGTYESFCYGSDVSVFELVLIKVETCSQVHRSSWNNPRVFIRKDFKANAIIRSNEYNIVKTI